MNPIRLGIVGLGRFAKLHLECYRHMPQVRIAAVCDLQAETAEAVAREWSCKGYSDWREMLAAEALDAAVVLTPEFAHVEPVTAALEAGCHVFVEKPLATASAEAARLVELAERRGRLLIVGHVCRFDPRYIRIKDGVDRGAFGKLRSIYARRNNGKEFFSVYRRANPVFILGIHDLDLMHWFTGSAVEEVYAQAPPNAGGDRDLVYAMLRFADGTVGVIENNWLLPQAAPAFMDVRMEVVGDEATAHLTEPDASLVIWDRHRSTAPPFVSGAEAYGRPIGPLFEELRHFAACVAAGSPSPILRPRDALAAVAAAEAVVRSIESGNPEAPHSYGVPG